MHSAGDLAMCLGNVNEHIGRHIDGFELVHGWYGIGQINFERKMLFEFCL